MIVIAGLIIGAFYGVRVAKKRGGKRLDLLQYGTIYAIFFALIGMGLTVFIDRMLG